LFNQLQGRPFSALWRWEYTGFCREHRQDTRAAPNVQDHLALEEMSVVVHGVAVGKRPDFVLQHLLVNTEVSVLVEVVEVAQRHVVGAALFTPHFLRTFYAALLTPPYESK
jgi:hypothetical protein